MVVKLDNNYRVGHLYVREMEKKSFEDWNAVFSKNMSAVTDSLRKLMPDERKSKLNNYTIGEIIAILHADLLKWKIPEDDNCISQKSIARNMGELFHIVFREITAGYRIPVCARTLTVSEQKKGFDRRRTFALDLVLDEGEPLLLGYVSFDVRTCHLETDYPKQKLTEGIQITGVHIFDAKLRDRDISLGWIINEMEYRNA